MLQKLGTKLINQANSTDALEKLGKTRDVRSLRDAINQVFEEVNPGQGNTKHLNDIIEKAKALLRLVRSNHNLVKDSKNFDLDDMQDDVTDVQDVIFRIESIHTASIDQLKKLNKLHKKHTRLHKLIEG